MIVNHSASQEEYYGYISIFFNMKIYCVVSLESLHRCTHNIPFSIYKKNQLKAIGFFSKGLKDKFERVVVNEPSVFEPLKFYCMRVHYANQESKQKGNDQELIQSQPTSYPQY